MDIDLSGSSYLYRRRAGAISKWLSYGLDRWVDLVPYREWREPRTYLRDSLKRLPPIRLHQHHRDPLPHPDRSSLYSWWSSFPTYTYSRWRRPGGRGHHSNFGLSNYYSSIDENPSYPLWRRGRWSTSLDSQFMISAPEMHSVGSAIRSRYHKVLLFPGYGGNMSVPTSLDHICSARRKDRWLRGTAALAGWDY